MLKKFDNYSLAQLCEIAYIFGQLEGRPELARKDRYYGVDIEDMLAEYEFIFECWSRGIDVKTEEEDGYVGAYAERFIVDYFYEDITKNTREDF